MPLPTAATLAQLALRFGPDLTQGAVKLYEQGRFRQLAIAHARTVVDGRFSDERVGTQRTWVVWAGDEPIAGYPEPAGGVDLAEALAYALPERRLDPDDLPIARTRRVSRERGRTLRDAVANRLRRDGDGDDVDAHDEDVDAHDEDVDAHDED